MKKKNEMFALKMTKIIKIKVDSLKSRRRWKDGWKSHNGYIYIYISYFILEKYCDTAPQFFLLSCIEYCKGFTDKNVLVVKSNYNFTRGA